MTQCTTASPASIALTRPARPAIVGRAIYIKSQIEQIFRDAEHWNATHPNKQPINADADGKLQAVLDGIKHMLVAEPPKGG